MKTKKNTNPRAGVSIAASTTNKNWGRVVAGKGGKTHNSVIDEKMEKREMDAYLKKKKREETGVNS